MSNFLTPVHTKFRPYEIISFDDIRKPSSYPIVWVIESLEKYLEFLTSFESEVFAIEDRCYDDQYLQLSTKQQNNVQAELSLLEYINYNPEKSGRLVLIDENSYVWEGLDNLEGYGLTLRNLLYLNTLDVNLCERNTPEGYITAIDTKKIAFFVDTSVDLSLYLSINLIKRILTNALPDYPFLLSGQDDPEFVSWPYTLATILKQSYFPNSPFSELDIVNPELTSRIVKAIGAMR